MTWGIPTIRNKFPLEECYDIILEWCGFDSIHSEPSAYSMDTADVFVKTKGLDYEGNEVIVGVDVVEIIGVFVENESDKVA